MNKSRLTLHQALMYLQAHYIAIRLTARSVALWSPNIRVSTTVRSVVREHSSEIRSMIRQSHIDVCPSPLLHRAEFYYPGPEWTTSSATCAVCQRLAHIGDPAANKSNFDKIKVRELSTFDVLDAK